MLIKDCPITHQDSKVIESFQSTDKINVKGVYGITITGSEIYSICDGNVIDVRQDIDSTWSVSVQYDFSNIFRYRKLSDYHVKLEEHVKLGQLVGICEKRVHFEHLNRVPSESDQYMSFGNIKFYKKNPLFVLKFYHELIEGVKV